MLISAPSTITSAVIRRQRHCGSNVNVRCRWQQGYGFSRLPQPIKRHEAVKNDVSILVVILATTPYWLWSARIHNAIAEVMANVLQLVTRLWIIQSASAYKTA